MTYSHEKDVVTLTMQREDFSELMLVLGFAAGAVGRQGAVQTFYRWIALANRINCGNPNFTPYEIPPEYDPYRKPTGNKEA